MSRAEPEHDLARGLEGKEIRLKNNTTTSLSRAASMDSQFHESNALAGKYRQYGDWSRQKPTCMVRRCDVFAWKSGPSDYLDNRRKLTSF